MRRLVLAPIVAVLLVACGTGGALPQLPLNAAAKEANGATDMMYPYRQVTYELADGVKADTDHATAYKVRQATSDYAKKLAAAFDVAGDVRANESGWTVGTQGDGNTSSGSSGSSGSGGATDPAPPPSEAKAAAPDLVSATAPYLFLAKNGSFSVNGDMAVSSGVGCASPAGGEPCPTTTTTTAPNLLSDTDARTKAERTLKQAGVDVSGMKVDVQRLVETVTVQFTPVIGGHIVDGYVTTIGYGSNGVLESAFGYVGDADEVGSYELATLARAVERLNDQSVYPARGGPEPAIAIGEPYPTNQDPLVVKLTAVRVGLMLTSDDNGDTLWLTPAYVFTTVQDNGSVTAPAAADKYFPTTTTSPSTPSTGETKPPATDGGAVPPSSGSGGGTVEPSPPAPTQGPNCVSTSDPIPAQVCSDKASYAAGETVHFTITASDPDRAFTDGPCYDGVTAEYGDDGGGDVRCLACSTSVPDGPGKISRTRDHAYAKAGKYAAKFTIKSGSECGPADPHDSQVELTLPIPVA